MLPAVLVTVPDDPAKVRVPLTVTLPVVLVNVPDETPVKFMSPLMITLPVDLTTLDVVTVSMTVP